MAKNPKQDKAYRFFISKGYSPSAASGIVGNLDYESGLDTSIEGDKGYKGGSSYGIAQFRGERLQRLKKMYGENWTDFDNQLNFVDWELNNTHKKARNILKSAKDFHVAGQAFSDYYEIPQKKYAENKNRRDRVELIHRRFANQDNYYAQEESEPQAVQQNPEMDIQVPDYVKQIEEQNNRNLRYFAEQEEKLKFAESELDKKTAQLDEKIQERNFINDLLKATNVQYNEEQPTQEFQTGGRAPIVVTDKNDPRYRAYQDSLSLYNNYNDVIINLKNKKYEEKSPIKTIKKMYSNWDFAKNKAEEKPKTTGLKKVSGNLYSVNDFIPATVNKNLPEQLFSNFIEPAGTQIFYNSSVYGKNVFHPKKIDNKIIDELERDDENWFTAKPDYRVVANYSNVKPKQQVIVEPKQQTVQPTSFQAPTQPPQIRDAQPTKQITPAGIQTQAQLPQGEELQQRTYAKIPTSYNVNSQRFNMTGENPYYDFNAENADYETALRAKMAAETYNSDIENRYGNEESLKNPKAVERLKKLRQKVQITPNYN